MNDLEGFRYYRSPFAEFDRSTFVPPEKYSEHFVWDSNRRVFEQTGSDESYDRMLNYVTMDNPPFDVEGEATDKEAWNFALALIWMALMVIATWIFIGILAGF